MLIKVKYPNAWLQMSHGIGRGEKPLDIHSSLCNISS